MEKCKFFCLSRGFAAAGGNFPCANFFCDFILTKEEERGVRGVGTHHI